MLWRCVPVTHAIPPINTRAVSYTHLDVYKRQDGDRTVAAATRQLDACDSPTCLRAAYAQWQAYFDENYDLGDVVDYQ